MKFLCLHGMGTSSEVLDAQLAPIRAYMSPMHEFFFLDGQIECKAADGVAAIFPGSFSCYYSKPTTQQLQDAFELIAETILLDGPFDGLIGFSQGAALGASLLLHLAKTAPSDVPPFKLAIFICASLPFDLCTPHNAPSYETSICMVTGQVLVRDWAPGDPVDEEEVNGYLEPLVDGDVAARRYHPAREKTRIQVPTLNVIGAVDPFAPQGRLLAELCTNKGPGLLMHSLGHRLPRDGEFARKAATMIEAIVYKVLYAS